MRRRPLESLGAMVRERRGSQTLRVVAKEIGVSPATLLRVESGRIPDVATFGRICRWLEIDPGVFLGSKSASERGNATIQVSAHLRADQNPQRETMQALAQMLLLVSRTQPLGNESAENERT